MTAVEPSPATRTREDEPLVLVQRAGFVATVTLNRGHQLNALSDELMRATVEALRALDSDRDVRAIVLTGSDRAFAAGADIKQMASSTAMEFAFGGRVEHWDALRGLTTPLVAAVSGHCLGGGCELAMACDLIVASETASFGQPETSVGIIPGAGGTQRLVRAIGKAKAMDVVLTGRTLSAREAERAGLVPDRDFEVEVDVVVEGPGRAVVEDRLEHEPGGADAGGVRGAARAVVLEAHGIRLEL